ncbi:DUF72 domain-containing protein [Pararhizobium haloflavum]|uniref:DUF72 domain-containing protein n=1 Tax=Pararhizobium haloflavum TaxID=2037914 RepID=UPI000C194F2A|nr:DUF72 domain-containing protein [Pararhizobium haloflavum]
MASGVIRTGIGGWVFEPWRETFYPDKLPKSRELEYAASQLTAIEVNATYYGSQKPATFAKWAASVPDGFVFSLKGSRYVTNRKELAQAADSIAKFVGQGIAELGDRLGPILWQFAPTKQFDPDDFDAFLELLPSAADGVDLQHAVEVRHDSFAVPEFIALMRKRNIAVVYAHHASYPEIADVTGDFVYARLQRGSAHVATCYPEDDLARWARRTQLWADGGQPEDLPLVAGDNEPEPRARDVYAYFISEGKSRAPHGAMRLAELTQK